METAFSPSCARQYLKKMDVGYLTDGQLRTLLHAIRCLNDIDAIRFTLLAIERTRLPPMELFWSQNDTQKGICLRACLIIYTVTRGRVVPRQFQLEASLETYQGRDSIIIAGTGHGKTLCIVIPLLLNPKKNAILVSPLKRLQLMQVIYFTSFGICTLPINEDTPH
ncbi:hypothetical protein CPC08DRAFT_717012 [Agrocybe pediades]|nr:hypothetical protein CPC08DRAFT_717012 [Agrocybe pediades]